MKTVKVGIFWGVPDKELGQRVLEAHENYGENEANSLGFINYSRSHYEVWDDIGKGLGKDCYRYPRGRVIYDAKRGVHKIFADECILQSSIDEIAELLGIEKYELNRDEHYVCPLCASRRREQKTLQYEILRGQDKIGENLIELSCGDTRILVELGRALEGADEAFEREILSRNYSAIVVSHYHEDHAGLIGSKRDCPIYIGSGAYRILQAVSEYRGETLGDNIRTYRNGHSFRVGTIKITPFLCDHSAFDSYMLLFEAGGKSILYTGDFRFHGRKSQKPLLAALPESVDVLIHEGTNLGKNPCTITESELEEQMLSVMKETKDPVFVLQSSTNFDRLVSVYRASKRSGRILYMDNYASLVASAAGGKIPRPDIFRDVFAFPPRALCGKRGDAFLEIKNKCGMKGIIKSTSYTMLVRPSMLSYLKKLFATAGYERATLVYSVWKGYKNADGMREFLDGMQALGVKVVDLHTSGHASAEDIELLKRTVKAKQTVCIHTEKLI